MTRSRGSCRKAFARVPGAVDVRVQQVVDSPQLEFNVDRIKAQQLGSSQRDVASDVLISLSSSGQTSPNFWLDPRNGVQYAVNVMTPQYKMGTGRRRNEHTDHRAGPATPQLFGNLATTEPRDVAGGGESLQRPADLRRATRRPTVATSAPLHTGWMRSSRSAHDTCRAARTINVRGQVQSMRDSFTGLGFGILFAIVLVYIILVVNFQSWLDPADHHHGAARRARRHRLDAVHHAHDTSRCRR